MTASGEKNFEHCERIFLGKSPPVIARTKLEWDDALTRRNDDGTGFVGRRAMVVAFWVLIAFYGTTFEMVEEPANILHPAFWLVAREDAVRPRTRKTRNNHAGALACTAFPLKRCIMGVKFPEACSRRTRRVLVPEKIGARDQSFTSHA
jgi:hypothetical protein